MVHSAWHLLRKGSGRLPMPCAAPGPKANSYHLTMARKGDVTCVIVESEDNLPYGDQRRDRLWIHVKECEPLTVGWDNRARSS